MAEGEESKAFFERRLFRAAVAVLGLVTAILAIVGPLRFVFEQIFPGAEHPTLNAEVIIDTSAAMGKKFQGKDNRHAAAMEALEGTRFWPPEGVGLRRTDPSCRGEEVNDLLVPIGAGNAEEVRSVAAAQKPRGSSNLVAAVTAAVSELNEPPYDHDPVLHKRVIVFASGVDKCVSDPAGELERLLKGSGVNRARSEFNLVALKPSPEEERLLNGFASVLNRAGADTHVWPAHNYAQLNWDAEQINRNGERRPGVPKGETTIPSG